MERKLLLEPIESNEWEQDAVFNPTAIKEKGTIHLIYRAVKHPNYSSLGYAKIRGSKIKRLDKPLIIPTEDYEKSGVEDPRITKIDDIYYLLYTAWDGINARVAYAESKDLKNFEKKGIISPNIKLSDAIKLVNSTYYKDLWDKRLKNYGDSIIWDKDAALFPEKINGKYAMLHRLDPDIQIVYFNKFKDLQNDNFWEKYFANIEEYIVMQPKYVWESQKVGAGPTPIKTEKGWLLIYHGADDKRVYRAGVALLDLKDPKKVIYRSNDFLFEPEYEWEKKGDVNNVVFPEGAVVIKDKLHIFYGAADTVIGEAVVGLEDLLKQL